MKTWLAWALAAAGLVAMGLFFAPKAEMIAEGHNDFLPLYVAGGLAPGPDLYQSEPYDAFATERFGMVFPNLRFSRLPFYALLLKPLSWLPYPAAYALWGALRLAAAVAFLWVWGTQGRMGAIVALCWSVPLIGALLNGQDAVFLPLILAGAYRLHAERPLAAGALLSLCAIKYHLFLTLPILFWRRPRLLAGFAAGAGVWIVLSFAAAGWSWLADYTSLLSDAKLMQVEMETDRSLSPNLHGLGLSAPIETLLVVLVLACTVWIAPRLRFGAAMAAVTTAGVLVSYHAFVADWLVVLFAGLMMWRHSAQGDLSRLLVVVLLTPLPAVFQIIGRPFAYLPALALLLCWAVYLAEARRPAALN